MKKIAIIASMAAALLSCGVPQVVMAQAGLPTYGDAETGQVLPAPATPPPGMTAGVSGDWNGARTDLYEHGLDFVLAYGNEIAWNPRGGTKRDVTSIGQAIVGINSDFEKIAGIKGGTSKVAVFYRHGPSLTQEANLGLLQQVQEAYGRGEIARLVEAWYQQSFDDDRVRLKFGRLPTNSDFASFSCDFQNLSFCAAPQGNVPDGGGYWFSAPASNWAALTRVNLGQDRKAGFLQIGAYQVNPKNIDPSNGFRLATTGGTGVLVPFEGDWTPVFGGDKPGYYRLGGWIETSRATDLTRDDAGNLTIVSGEPGSTFHGRQGFYYQMAQQLTPSPAGLDRQGLSVFFNFTQLDRKSSLIDQQIALGLTQTGMFNGRPNDQIAIALVRTHVNSRLRSTDQIAIDQGALDGVRRSEYIVEVDYRYVPFPGVRISPNLQWGIDPGAISENRNVLVLGIKSSILF